MHRIARILSRHLAGITAMVFLLAPSAIAQTPPSTGVLDGRTFAASIVRRDSGARRSDALSDRLTFRSGRFISEVCRRYNFTASAYSANTKEGALHFSAVLRSPTHGVMFWQGTIHDGKLDGTMRWVRKRWYRTIDVSHRIRGRQLPAGSTSGSVDDK